MEGFVVGDGVGIDGGWEEEEDGGGLEVELYILC